MGGKALQRFSCLPPCLTLQPVPKHRLHSDRMENPQDSSYSQGGDQQNVANYRPISLLSITSIVLEKAIFNKVITFVRARLSRAQFGFLRGRSYLFQLLTSLTRIFNDLDRGAVAVHGCNILGPEKSLRLSTTY